MSDRVDQWERRLMDVVRRYRATPFDWENANCVHMMIDVAEALTGERKHERLLKGVKSARTAHIRVARAGDLGRALAERLEEVAPSLARRGDLAVVRGGDGQLCGGVVLEEDVLVRSEQGTTRVPRSSPTVERTFRI